MSYEYIAKVSPDESTRLFRCLVEGLPKRLPISQTKFIAGHVGYEWNELDQDIGAEHISLDREETQFYLAFHVGTGSQMDEFIEQANKLLEALGSASEFDEL